MVMLVRNLYNVGRRDIDGGSNIPCIGWLNVLEQRTQRLDLLNKNHLKQDGIKG